MLPKHPSPATSLETLNPILRCRAAKHRTPFPLCLIRHELLASQSFHKLTCSRLFVGLGGLFALVSGYYFLHTPRSPNEGHSAIQEKRKEQGTQNEYRDPRDSGVKTLEQKKARDGQ